MGGYLQATGDNVIQHVCFVSWMIKATDTHSEYIILIAFPWQQLYIHCLVCMKSEAVMVTSAVKSNLIGN